MTSRADSILDPLDVFQLFDSIGDGRINISDIGDLLRALGLNPTNAALSKLLWKFSSNDRIDFQVFLPLYYSMSKKVIEYSAEDFLEAFRNIDRDGDGVIHSSELRLLLTTYGEKLTNDEMDRVVSNVEDLQGLVDYSKLVYKVLGAD